MMNRRHFLDTLGVGSLVALAPMAVRAATSKRVVVVGGGMAGATVAKYLRLWSNKTVDVTLVDTSTQYTSNIMSNLVVTGQYAPTILDYGWSNLVKKHGVKLLNGTVTQVEPGGSLGAWKVTVAKGTTVTVLYCERVVLAPGVQFDAVPSTVNPAEAASILHAWQAGAADHAVARLPRRDAAHRNLRYDDPEGALPLPTRAVRAGLCGGRLPEAQQAGRTDRRAGRQPGHHGREGELLPCVLGDVRLQPHLPNRPRREESLAAVAGQPGGSVVVDMVVKDASGQDMVMGIGDLRRTGAERDPAAPRWSHRAAPRAGRRHGLRAGGRTHLREHGGG